MAKCSICGAKAGLMMNMCDACIAQDKTKVIDSDVIKPASTSHAESAGNSGYGGWVLFAGVAILILGVVNLVDPTSAMTNAQADTLSQLLTGSHKANAARIINLHKLVIGMTCTITGTMLLLAGLKSLKHI